MDDFIQLIEQKGVGCLLYKADLRRAFRQLSLCPSSYNVCVFVLNKHIFCNCVLPMGAKSSGFLSQRFTNAISFILFKIEICILNYLNELASTETSQNAHFDLDLYNRFWRNVALKKQKKAFFLQLQWLL